jgi:acyl transferase domain-containing protein
MALAGGASILVPQQAGHLYQAGTTSRAGRCRSFDADADGMVRGSGVGLVALKRLDDALTDGDTIHAVILGSAINNDGALKAGFTAPSVSGQRAVIQAAQAAAGVSSEAITYLEAHGSATPLGDPIEVEALAGLFPAEERGAPACALGSVKANIGHLGAAAGIAGLLKTVLALRYRQIPPSVNFVRLNPEIDLERTRLFVTTSCSRWDASNHPRCAGVSSFGMGGTNAHVIVQEAPSSPLQQQPSRPVQMLLLSARSERALDSSAESLARCLEEDAAPALPDVAHTLRVGRHAFAHRLVVTCASSDEAVRRLRDRPSQRRALCEDSSGRRRDPQRRLGDFGG